MLQQSPLSSQSVYEFNIDDHDDEGDDEDDDGFSDRNYDLV